MKPRAVTYQCVRCPKQHTAAPDSALALLAICAECQATRFAAGKKAQRSTPPVAAKTPGET